MAYLAVDKDGTEMISDYSLYRSGYYRKYKKNVILLYVISVPLTG